MFDDEADTIPLEVGSVIEALRTGTLEAVIVDENPADTLPAEPMLEFEDTPVFVPQLDLHPPLAEPPPTDKQRIRPTTDADWPPAPKPPTARTVRRAGMYQAITSITKLTKKAPTP